MSKSKKKVKKKIGAFYKVSFSIIMIASILLFYFAVLVATGPKSFKFITKKIEEKVVTEFGAGSSINNSQINFTAYGSLKVTVLGLNIFYSNLEEENNEFFTIPRLEAEFSLFDFLLLNFQPSKIKVVEPVIVVNDINNLKAKHKGLEEEGQLSAIIGIISALHKDASGVKNFEIENAKFLIFRGDAKTDILLKKAQIQISKKGKFLTILSQNQINFDEEKRDVNLDANCQFSKIDGLRCDLFLENFSPDSISNLHSSLADLSKISADLDAKLSLKVQNGEVGNIVFKAKSDVGNFDFPQFFSQKIDFKNLSLLGEYDSRLKILNISSIEADFLEKNTLENLPALNPHLSMSLIFSHFAAEHKTSQIYIKLQNILTNDLEKFWPISLDQAEIRPWVLKHVKDGIIKNAYAKFSLNHAEETSLNDIDSQVIFSGANLQYDESFPKISNISAIASFRKNDMRIAISDADVLDSKISNALVEIKDFAAKKTILDISGSLKGKAQDGLRHANHDAEFSEQIAEYLNGEAESKFKIRLNLTDEITLKSTYISAESLVKNLTNEFIRGDILVKTEKPIASNNFSTKIDLTNAKIAAKEFDIFKESGVKSDLSLIVKILSHGKKIALDKVALSSAKDHAKINADIDLQTSPFKVTRAVVKNDNFGKNDFTITYIRSDSLKQIFIKGKKLNFGALVENKFFKRFHGGDRHSALKVRVYLPRLELLKSKVLRNFSLALNCSKSLCYSGLMKGSYFGKESVDLKITTQPKDNFSMINGEISELGYLAEGFGISNVVDGGNAKIKIKNTAPNNKQIFEGDVTVDEDITIYETATVKRLAKDDLFSKIKDKIFSSEKTTFDSVKIKFDFQDGRLTLHSLIANNYKIGITAKGFLNIKDSTYQLKGMIIPGFLINNLFGIGNIPLIGGVISGILTGGEGGGVFGIRYEYVRDKKDKEGKFTTNAVSSFVPSTIQNLFDF